MNKSAGFFFVTTLALVSCGDLLEVRTISPKAQRSSKFSEGGSGISEMGGYADAKIKKESEDIAVGMTPEMAGYLPEKVGDNVVVGDMKLPSDDDFEWAPMNLDTEFKLGDKFKNRPKKKTSWVSSYQEARRESMREGKPLLIWFTKTGSPGSPMCARLQREVFAKADFEKWAKEKLVRLKIDATGGKREVDEFGQLTGSVTARRKYAERLKKQFDVLGYPTLVVLQPDGAVYTRERGFSRGGKSELWGKLKNAALTIDHNHGVWERKMAKRGYRKWLGMNDEVVFAKLTRYYNGNLWLTEPDGNVVKTSQKYLSKNDRGWIIAEKEKRGL
jgi:thioredoxin-related protein